jgi:hypothetical protein
MVLNLLGFSGAVASSSSTGSSCRTRVEQDGQESTSDRASPGLQLALRLPWHERQVARPSSASRPTSHSSCRQALPLPSTAPPSLPYSSSSPVPRQPGRQRCRADPCRRSSCSPVRPASSSPPPPALPGRPYSTVGHARQPPLACPLRLQRLNSSPACRSRLPSPIRDEPPGARPAGRQAVGPLSSSRPLLAR